MTKVISHEFYLGVIFFFFPQTFFWRFTSPFHASHKLRNSHLVTFDVDIYYSDFFLKNNIVCNAHLAKPYGAIIAPWIMNPEKA